MHIDKNTLPAASDHDHNVFWDITETDDEMSALVQCRHCPATTTVTVPKS